MTQPDRIRIIIVDDRNEVRSGLATFLRAFDDLELVGEASDGAEAIRLCHEVKPDVILMDILMPKMDGIHATRAIARDCPEARVIMLIGLDDEDLVQEALQAGAIACFPKDVSIDVLAGAIRTASRKPTTNGSKAGGSHEFTTTP
jgi:NarL family two-component system response regulator LiaR